ncbi:hypothetical protein J6590_053039 [Homalodisca vitripennis]|nr:hypothetical protein J6590_053039 [Homalodisca vitripennis]
MIETSLFVVEGGPVTSRSAGVHVNGTPRPRGYCVTAAPLLAREPSPRAGLAARSRPSSTARETLTHTRPSKHRLPQSQKCLVSVCSLWRQCDK